MLRGYTPDGQGTGGYSVSGGVALSTLVTGLVAYWSLDETSGTRADSVGSADLTDNNTVGSAAGKNSNAASFVAANTESLSIADFVMPDSYTISLWSSKSAGDSYPALVKACGATWYTQAQVVVYWSEAAVLRCIVGDGTNYPTADIGSLTATNLNFVVATYDASSKKCGLSVNGSAVTLSAALAGTRYNTATTFSIATGDTGDVPNRITGLIDEVGLWSRVLTEDERAELYNSGTGKFFNGTDFV